MWFSNVGGVILFEGRNLSTSSNMSDSDRNIRIKPLFFKNDEVEQSEEIYLNTCEICEAVVDVVGNDAYVDAAQRIGGLWRESILFE